MTPEFKRTIALLKQISFDPRCERMNRSSITGYLGELYVLEKLQREGRCVKQMGKQCAYDLLLDGIQIDVKCSTLKKEGKNNPRHWGWALKNKRKKKVGCDVFVCLALSKKLTPKSYYIVLPKDLGGFHSGFRQYNTIEKAFHVRGTNQPPGPKASQQLLSKLDYDEKLLKHGVIKKIDPVARLSIAIECAYRKDGRS